MKQLPANWHELPKWDKLRVWLKVRFTHMEDLHNKTFLGADANNLGVIRDVVNVMSELDQQEASVQQQALNASPSKRRGK